MSRFYISAAVYGNEVLLREVDNGKDVLTRVDWSPTLYHKSKKEQSDFVSLYGDPVKSVQMESISAAREHIKEFKDVHGFEVFGQTNYVLQYLHQYKMDGWDPLQIDSKSIDIETEVPESGFPVPSKAEAEVVLITVDDIRTGKAVTFGTKPYDGRDTAYTECVDEPDLFRKFLNWWQMNCPHVVTGWNIDDFDIPYLAVRIGKILGPRAVNQLSPWGKVKIEPDRKFPDKLVVEIVGVSSLDYLNLMKKYTYGQRTSWSLAAVAQEELGHTKLDHSEFANFNDFMNKDWPKFVRYNIVDAKLISALDKKMRLIELALTVAFKARVNFQDVYSPVKTWDAIIHNHLLDLGIVVPQRKQTGFSGESIDGAFVKQPVPGFYNLMVSVDATSLYPSIMMGLNLSPETYKGQIDSSVELCLAGRWPEIPMGHSMGANGSLYSTDKKGVLPALIEDFMAGRKTAKNSMLSLQSEYERTKDESLQSKIAALNNEQMAIKILLNSLYGALANAGFRFFNPDVAESITLTGQLYLRSVDKALPGLMVEKFKLPEKDYVVYADTDSIYISMEEIVKKYMSGISDINKIIKGMEKTVQVQIQPLINGITEGVSKQIGAYSHKIFFKLEIAADKAIFCSKKKYVCRVYSSEGVTYAKPKYKVMGLEMVRSSTPLVVRDMLKDALEVIFSSTESEVQRFIQEKKTKFMEYPVEAISKSTGVKGIDTYSDKNTIYTKSKSVPIHVRATLLYNRKIEDLGLLSTYKLIKEGEKVKMTYLKMPNTLRENIIAWPVDDVLPPEFGLHKYVDFETQFEKTFLSAMSIILNSIKWSPIQVANLDEFFG